MGSRYSPKTPNGPLPEIPSLPAAVLARGAAGLQPGPRRFCCAGGVHGELEAGPTLGVRGITALFCGGEAVTENLRDPTGDLGGSGDDTYVGVSVGGSFLGRHDDLVVPA
jgi:hypothetical protein